MSTTLPRQAARPGKPTSSATRHLYDVIVVGAQLGGTLAGALLAKRGHRVLHIDPDGLGDHYEDHGYALPWAPAVLPSLKLMPGADAALVELGIASDVNRVLEGGGSDLQLLYPRHRLELASDEGRRAAEVSREFAADKEKILSAVAATAGRAEASDPFFKSPPILPPEGFFDRYALRKAASACPPVSEDDALLAPLADHPVGSAMRALSRFLMYLDDDEATGLSRLRPLAQALRGAHRYPGGQLGLREAVKKRLGDLGGELVGGEKSPAIVEELAFDGSKITGVKLASSDSVFRAQCVIAALDVSAVGKLIPPKSKKRKLSELFDSVRTKRFLFTVNLVVKAAGLPLGLGELGLLLPGDETFGPILLEVLPAKRAGGGEHADERVICAGMFIPGTERQTGDDRLREIGKKIEAAVLEIAPFLERHVVARSMPSLDAKNARDGFLPHPLLEIAQQRFLGITGLPQRTACRNLFLASRENVPGLGVEGEFIAGMRVANIVQEVLKKHDPLK